MQTYTEMKDKSTQGHYSPWFTRSFKEWRVKKDWKKTEVLLPCHDDEKVQSVPSIAKITATAKDPQSHHLHHHLQCKENIDKCIESLEEINKDTVYVLIERH